MSLIFRVRIECLLLGAPHVGHSRQEGAKFDAEPEVSAKGLSPRRALRSAHNRPEGLLSNIGQRERLLHPPLGLQKRKGAYTARAA